eukprot:CAMPEP_0185777166 /NCGR_PEP_ID=MMETSP1174-20130828/88489_1 /TAXON_ID=35687 /ORGANISM="Dictyocha speculum, Strain CCMP1381" /LENGTH=118 /DNA_ID=CAMNT_0028465443 /DNA_START=415 /DNA_END=768 /DNA_ORIENTATION=-
MTTEEEEEEEDQRSKDDTHSGNTGTTGYLGAECLMIGTDPDILDPSPETRSEGTAQTSSRRSVACASPERWDMLERRIEMIERNYHSVRSALNFVAIAETHHPVKSPKNSRMVKRTRR